MWNIIDDYQITTHFGMVMGPKIKVTKMKQVVFSKRKRQNKKYKKRYDLYLKYEEDVDRLTYIGMCTA